MKSELFKIEMGTREDKMIIEIEMSDVVKWNGIVRSFKNYDVFYLNSYVRAFAEEGDAIPLLLYYKKNGKRAINVVMKRDIANDEHFKGKIPPNTYYDLITPYGYGGFLSDEDFAEELYSEFEIYCRTHGYVSEFVRFGLFNGYEKIYGGEIESRTHNVVRNLDCSLEDLKMNFEHKVRKNIKRAEKNGLEILVEQNTEHLEEFLCIYYGTMERADATDEFYFKKQFFEILSTMEGNFAYFYVLFQGKVISAELVLFGANYAYSYLGGTDSAYFQLRPNDFLKYEIIKWLKNKGFKNFVLGGGYGSDDGIFRYKKSFAPNGVVNFYIGKNIFDDAIYERLVELRKEGDKFDKESSFFPIYRA